MPAAPRLLSVATAVPPYRLDQGDVIRRVQALFGDAPGLDRLLPVFANAGIRARYSSVPIEWYDRPHGWAERNRVYIAAALDLLERTTIRLLDQAGIDKRAIDAVVTVSTTGIATPSLDALLIERLGLRRDVRRLPIFGLGCAGGVIGLARAATRRSRRPAKPCCFLSSSCAPCRFAATTGRRATSSRPRCSATARPGRCCRPIGEGPAIVASGEHTWPGSLDIMGWDVADDGFSAVFSRDIPQFVATQLARGCRPIPRPPQAGARRDPTSLCAIRAAPRS